MRNLLRHTTLHLAILIAVAALQSPASAQKTATPKKAAKSAVKSAVKSSSAPTTAVDTLITAGKKKVELAYSFQRKLLRGLETVQTVSENWHKTTLDEDVRKDPDALAIALGCEALMELERGNDLKGDSLLLASMPFFRKKTSKSYFLVSLANLDKKLSFYDRALTSFSEIVSEYDSLPELANIDFYKASGYAPFAYAIDAALGISSIGASKEETRERAVGLLTKAAAKHPNDALGLMCLTGLKHLDMQRESQYQSKIDKIITKDPSLREASAKFESQFIPLTK